MDPGLLDLVTFSINGTLYKVHQEFPVDTSLNTFIREYACLPGTKFMCTEGGCGCCVVTMQSTHPVTKMEKIYAVNSCLVPVLSCHGSAITTVEGLGDKSKGYNKIQAQLARFNGTQCGFCSPGMVMNMNSLLKSNPKLTKADIEDSFGGNVCRCTGYRPILDAFKSLSTDGFDHEELCVDIEDVLKICPERGTICQKSSCKNCPKKENGYKKEINITDDEIDEDYETSFTELALSPKSLKFEFLHSVWYKVGLKQEIFQIFDLIGSASYMLVAGNSAQGVYPPRVQELPINYIDIKDVPELRAHRIYRDHIELGGNMTLAELIQIFSALSKENQLMFGYLQVLADHLNLVASVPVRNIASLAGNLMIKYKHREFQSDIFLLMETSGATITLSEPTGIDTLMPLLQFYETNMHKKIISNIKLPAISSVHYYMKTYKIMPRAQNTHAMVNAGFLFRLDRLHKIVVVERPTIVYGGINGKFVHAYSTESFLAGKPILNQTILKSALQLLSRELSPDVSPPEPSPKYRKLLAMGLFYRYILSISPLNIKSFYRSGSYNLIRPLSSGKQEFSTFKDEWPVSKPIPKLEALIQCSGEAEYVNDIPKIPRELHAEFVITDVGPATIESIDSSEALKMPGVVAFYSAKDIPGRNVFIVKHFFSPEEEVLFADTEVLYAGQPVGIVVAESRDIANKATQLVKIHFKNTKKPLLTVSDVLASEEKNRITLQASITPTRTGENTKYKISGEFKMGSQYHYTMEPQSCVCVPIEDGIDVYSATQWMQCCQEAISAALDIPENSINMKVKRVGGAYGAKITRASMIATACSLAANKLNRPTRMVLQMITNTKAIGKRNAILSKYETGVDDNGKIQYLIIHFYENYGCALNDPVIQFSIEGIKNGYDFSTWKVDMYAVKTDLPSSVWTRAPGNVESMATIEYIMEHIAQVVKKDPIEVRLENFPANSIMKDKVLSLQKSSDFDKRKTEIMAYNEQNRWKKRGIALSQMNFKVGFFANFYSMLSIYSRDGTVAITHGGVEIGQGINTKAAQVCAYTLGIPLELIKVKPTNNLTSPDSGPTGGSLTSDTVTYATIKCCEEINRRLQPVKEKLKNPTWQQLILQAYNDGVDLNTSFMYSSVASTDSYPKDYFAHGVAVVEVEADMLTGQQQILRTDILEDAGKSLSPEIDIGQVEGAFVMGLGYFLSEEIIHDPKSGELLTNRTWNYLPPGPKDIPIDFRITLEKNVENPVGVLRSKATGEPACCLAMTIMFALRNTLKSARKDAKLIDDWFRFDPPCTPENILLTSGTSTDQFDL